MRRIARVLLIAAGGAVHCSCYGGSLGRTQRWRTAPPDPDGIAAVVRQQFEIARQVLGHGMVPIIEPEVNIKSPSRDQADRIRQAVKAGVTGPIIDVEDPDGDGVLISVE